MQVGDYVRTKNGEIFKKPLYSTSDIIVKSSPNIIDLIEVGDYVNGKRINFIHKDIYDGEEWVADKGLENETTSQILLEEDIKSIVTKEQFENMEYKLGVDKE